MGSSSTPLETEKILGTFQHLPTSPAPLHTSLIIGADVAGQRPQQLPWKWRCRQMVRAIILERKTGSLDTDFPFHSEWFSCSMWLVHCSIKKCCPNVTVLLNASKTCMHFPHFNFDSYLHPLLWAWSELVHMLSIHSIRFAPHLYKEREKKG